MVVEAVNSVKMTTLSGDVKYPIKSVNIVKSHGQSSLESRLIKGYLLQMSRASQQMPVRIENAKIACLDLNLSKFKMQMGVQILVNDPKNLEKIRQKECDVLRDRLKKIIDAGANVILTTKGIDDIASKYMVEANILGLRRVDKNDLRRIAKSTGATMVTTLASIDSGEEAYDASNLGTAGEVYEETVGDNDFVFIKGFKTSAACSILVRGANEHMIDEIERSIHDSICVVKRTLESGYVVAGGGAVEIALGIYLEDFAKTLGSKEQIAIAEYCEALCIIPKVLAINAAQDATQLLSKMRVFHNAAQNSDDAAKKEFKWIGLDLVNGKCRNNLQAGVVEPMDSKIKCLR